MYPCTNPRVCGVTNHLDGTICKAQNSTKSFASDSRGSFDLLNISSAGGRSSKNPENHATEITTPRVINTTQEVKEISKEVLDGMTSNGVEDASAEATGNVYSKNDKIWHEFNVRGAVFDDGEVLENFAPYVGGDQNDDLVIQDQDVLNDALENGVNVWFTRESRGGRNPVLLVSNEELLNKD